MKNIWEKLNPEIRDSILVDKDKYPVSTKSYVNGLKKADFWSELTMHYIQVIINHSHKSFLEISINSIMWGDGFIKKDKDE